VAFGIYKAGEFKMWGIVSRVFRLAVGAVLVTAVLPISIANAESEQIQGFECSASFVVSDSVAPEAQFVCAQLPQNVRTRGTDNGVHVAWDAPT
jgi:hypothetical protein